MGAANPIRVLHKMESSLDSSVLSNTGVFRGRAEGGKSGRDGRVEFVLRIYIAVFNL